MRGIFFAAILLFAANASAQTRCGDIRSFDPPSGGKFAVSIAAPQGPPAFVFVLLPGGSGLIDLDPQGCPRALRGNSLIRAIPEFHKGGAVTALVDAPAEWRGQHDLSTFRIEPGHAEALGVAIKALRETYRVTVWLVGTSRGAISAANGASRLTGDAAPDGVILTSPVSQGARGNLPFVSQDVFQLPLARISMPLLVLGHAGDTCVRSPPENVRRIADAAAASPRKRAHVMTGGPSTPPNDPQACEGRSPHGFAEQEAEMAAHILRFVRGE
ncbi:MAG: alpha/beta fold hydrolase [Tagaea sp.]